MCSTAKRSSIGFSQVCLTKVEACKSFLFTESSLVLKIKNTLLIFVITLYMCHITILIVFIKHLPELMFVVCTV